MACANQIEAYTLSTSGAQDGETFTWTIVPATAGSVVDGQGTDQVEIQWNDFTGNATIEVTSSLCGIHEVGTFTVNVNPQPEPVIAQSGYLCPGAISPATLATTTAYTAYDWTPPSGPNVSGSPLLVNAAGSYSVEVTDGQWLRGVRHISRLKPPQFQLPSFPHRILRPSVCPIRQVPQPCTRRVPQDGPTSGIREAQAAARPTPCRMPRGCTPTT